MTTIGVVVEGLGDRRSLPALVAKTSLLLKRQVYVSQIVEGGGWGRQKRPSELEKNCLLVAADGGVAGVLIIVDLEDECAKSESAEVLERLAQISARVGLPVHLCFCVREYETWFLQSLDSIIQNSPEIEWAKRELEPGELERRGAKEAFQTHLGTHYRPSIDQEKFTKRMDLAHLLETSRSYQKFAKIVTQLADLGNQIILVP